MPKNSQIIRIDVDTSNGLNPTLDVVLTILANHNIDNPLTLMSVKPKDIIFEEYDMSYTQKLYDDYVSGVEPKFFNSDERSPDKINFNEIPPLVASDNGNGTYTLLDGHHRLFLALKDDIKEIRTYVVPTYIQLIYVREEPKSNITNTLRYTKKGKMKVKTNNNVAKRKNLLKQIVLSDTD